MEREKGGLGYCGRAVNKRESGSLRKEIKKLRVKGTTKKKKERIIEGSGR